MNVARATDGVFERGDAGRFTGEVWLRGTITAPDATNIGVVHFSPAARTHWHRHPGGQFLYCVTGRGRVRTRGEIGHTLEPGDVIHVGPDEWHFHGGGPETPLVHVAERRRNARVGRASHGRRVRRRVLNRPEFRSGMEAAVR